MYLNSSQLLEHLPPNSNYKSSKNPRFYLQTIISGLCIHYNLLPSSFFIRGIEWDYSRFIDGGGFADIFSGRMGNQIVALKRVRRFFGDAQTGVRNVSESIFHTAVLTQVEVTAGFLSGMSRLEGSRTQTCLAVSRCHKVCIWNPMYCRTLDEERHDNRICEQTLTPRKP